MPYRTKRHTKKVSSKRHRRGHRMMKGGYFNPNTQFNPSTYVYSPNASDAATYETATVGTLNQQMQASDSSAYAHSNGIDYAKINPNIMNATQSGATAMQSSQSGGKVRKQYQQQYQNQQQNQRGGVWNQMIGDAVAPLVLLGLQQYYGPRSKTRMHKKSYKGKITKKYRK